MSSTISNSLSIVIPTYRRKDSLVRLLDLLLLQEGVVPEIVVVDQNPPEFLDGALPAAPNIRRLILEKPNVSDARNQGFVHSTGELVLFIDDDLVPESDFCRKGMEIFHNFPAISCFSPLVYTIEGKEASRKDLESKMTGRLEGSEEIIAISDALTAAFFFRRSYFEESGGFDPMLFEFAGAAEDQEFFLRMKKRKQVLYFVPTVEVFHDESVPGGCDMRTAKYWTTREKCMKSWAFRYRIHHDVPGKLTPNDIYRMVRSAFLNREGLTAAGQIPRQMQLLMKGIRTSKAYLKDKVDSYLPPETMSHLTALK